MRHNNIFRLTIIFISLVLSISAASSQSATRLGHQAGKAYEKKDYPKAQKLYKAAIKADTSMLAARFGLGDALYMQKKYKEAIAEYDHIARSPKVEQQQAAEAFFNMGNSFMRLKDYQKAVEAYKGSLLASPNDNKFRYNYTLAKKLLQKQQQQQQQNQNKQDQNKDKNKDQKQDQKQDQKNNPQQNHNQDQKEEPQNLDKQSAENILDAVKQDEDKTRQKIEAFQKKKKQQKVKNKPNW